MCPLKKPELELESQEFEKALIMEEPRYVTEISPLKNVTISGKQVILDKKCAGILAEIYFLSDKGVSGNDEYNVKIVADGVPVYDDSYTNFAIFSSYENDINVGSDATYYYAIFKNVAFLKSILIEVYNSTASFDIIKLKLHKEV